MTRVLIAGVGNVFLRDDGFGVEVAARLAREPWPEGVVVRDVGVRALLLAYDLLEPPDLLVIVDLASRGEVPGTLYVIEPTQGELAPSMNSAGPHGMDLASVVGAVESLGGTMPRTRIVGCEPAEIDEGMGLSAPVSASVHRAVELVRRLVREELGGLESAADLIEEE